ncbi:MAG: tyrosine-type recombinase/integrase [Lachnospiraceae bacterium]|nr:tyrosine-type recombinase/integrase [Lachnospiraceae bacterium]
MGTTQPIRNKQDLNKFTEYYRKEQVNSRNYALIVLGLNTALRISDILDLKWQDVYDFENDSFCMHICVQEKKTGKQNRIPLNAHVKDALFLYKKERNPKSEHYIFTKNTNFDVPLNRTQAYRIIRKAAEMTINEPNISCHSLRKTFGYHAWKQGTPPALLMDIYNHSSYRITKRYLGITQDERDAIYMKINL